MSTQIAVEVSFSFDWVKSSSDRFLLLSMLNLFQWVFFFDKHQVTFTDSAWRGPSILKNPDHFIMSIRHTCGQRVRNRRCVPRTLQYWIPQLGKELHGRYTHLEYVQLPSSNTKICFAAYSNSIGSVYYLFCFNWFLSGTHFQ